MREEMLKKIDRENSKRRAMRVLSISDELGHEIPAQDLELPFLRYNDILVATDSFSEASMIGKGGFGKVYKVCHLVVIFAAHIYKLLNNIYNLNWFLTGKWTNI